MSRNVQRAICFGLIIGILGSCTLCYVNKTATFAQRRKKTISPIINSEVSVTNRNWNYHMIHAIPAVSEREQAEKVKVANSYVELYSARVLDSKNKAPIHLMQKEQMNRGL